MKILVRILVVLAVTGATSGLVLWLSLRPPDPLPVPEPGAVLSGVNVVEPGSGRRTAQRVVVEGDVIAAIEPDADPSGPYVGATVLPGLIDMHVHFPPPSGLGTTELFSFLFLYHGVTTVRHAGDIDGTTTEPVRGGVERNAFPGPRVFACGPFVDGPDTQWANSRQVLGPGDAAAVVEEIARDYDCVKTYGSLSPDAAEAVHAAARERGIPVIGHVPTGARFDEAHIDDVQHMMGLAFREGDAGPFPKSMKAWRGMSDERMDEILSVALERGTALTPTLVTHERMSRMNEHAKLTQEPDALLLPRYFRDIVWAPRDDLTVEDYAGIRDAVRVEQRLLKRLHEGGVRVHMGTDVLVAFVVPGASMHRELALYVEAGITPEEAWRIATHQNGDFLDLPDLGRLDPGAPADLLVFREDPTRDLSALSSLQAVISRGRLYPRPSLDDWLARYESYARGAIFDRVSVALVRRLLAPIREEPDD